MLATWADEATPAEQGYLFVLEDSQTRQVVGISGLEAAVGLSDPWYNYRLGTLVHASRDLDIYNQMPTLFLSNDHTGYSELCTLFLDPDYRHSKNGQLLSKCRFRITSYNVCYTKLLRWPPPLQACRASG